MNSRRLTSDIRLPRIAWGRRRSAYRTLSLPQKGRRVLGLNLNRSESTWGLPTPLCFQPNDSTPPWDRHRVSDERSNTNACWKNASPQKYWKYGFSTQRSHRASSERS